MTKATSAIPFSVWRKIAMATWRPTGGGRRPLEGGLVEDRCVKRRA